VHLELLALVRGPGRIDRVSGAFSGTRIAHDERSALQYLRQVAAHVHRTATDVGVDRGVFLTGPSAVLPPGLRADDLLVLDGGGASMPHWSRRAFATVRSAPCPVVIVTARPGDRQEVVVQVPPRGAPVALRFAAGVARSRRAALVVLCTGAAHGSVADREEIDSEREWDRTAVLHLGHRLRGEFPGLAVTAELLDQPDPVDAVLERAGGCWLLVVPTSRRVLSRRRTLNRITRELVRRPPAGVPLALV